MNNRAGHTGGASEFLRLFGKAARNVSITMQDHSMLFRNTEIDGLNIFYREAGDRAAPKITEKFHVIAQTIPDSETPTCRIRGQANQGRSRAIRALRADAPRAPRIRRFR